MGLKTKTKTKTKIHLVGVMTMAFVCLFFLCIIADTSLRLIQKVCVSGPRSLATRRRQVDPWHLMRGRKGENLAGSPRTTLILWPVRLPLLRSFISVCLLSMMIRFLHRVEVVSSMDGMQSRRWWRNPTTQSGSRRWSGPMATRIRSALFKLLNL